MTEKTYPQIKFKTLSACPLCDSREIRQIYDLSPKRVWECGHCALHFLNPCLDESSMEDCYETSDTLVRLSGFLEDYYEYGSLDTRTKTLQEIRQCLRRIEKYQDPCNGSKMCEAGSGNGMFVAAARERGWQVLGIDSSAANVARARERFSVELHCGRFEDFQAPDGSFDVVVMRDLLEHRYDPHAFVGRAVRLIKRGGVVLITVPNHDSMLYHLSKLLYGASGKRFSLGLCKAYLLEHTMYYTPGTLNRLLTAHGIEPAESFQTSTDLARYRLSLLEKFLAYSVLFLGKISGLQNRITVLGIKK